MFVHQEVLFIDIKILTYFISNRYGNWFESIQQEQFIFRAIILFMEVQQLEQAIKVSHSKHQLILKQTQQAPQQQTKAQELFHNQYFANLNNNNHSTFKHSQQTAKIYAQIVQHSMIYHIDQGQLKISSNKLNLQPFLQVQKLPNEELRLYESKMKKQQKQKQFKYLHVWFRNKTEQPDDQLQPPNIFTKQQHKKLVTKFISQRRHRQKRHQQLLAQQQRKLKSLSQQKLKQQHETQIIQKLRKKQQILNSIKHQKELHQEIIKNQHQSVQKLKSLKKHKFLYEKIQDKYKSQILIPLLEEKKKQLKQIRQIRNFNINQIKEHERSYILKKSQHKVKILDHNKTQEFNYKPPHKTERLAQILEEQKMLFKFNQLQKKRKIQENRQKQQNFIQDVKIKYKPKLDKKKQEEIQLRLLNELSLQKNIKQPVDRVQVGLKYLQQVRKMKKKQKKQNISNEILQIDEKDKSKSTSSRNDKSFSSSSKLVIRHNIQQVKRNNIKKMIDNQQVQVCDKIHMLKIQNQRLSQLYKMKEKFLKSNQNQSVRQQAVDLLLSSIQTKLGLIDICQG